MWLTLHFSWSVYFSIYNNVHPRHGPRLPPHITRHDAHHTHHVLRWTQTHRHVTPTHEKLQQIQWLSQLRQLLWNQLPLFRVYSPEWFVITVCVASADYIFIPYPYRVVWLLLWSQNRPTLDSDCLAHAHKFCALVSVSKIPATARETAGAEDHTGNSALTTTNLYSYTDSLISLPLGWERYINSLKCNIS